MTRIISELVVGKGGAWTAYRNEEHQALASGPELGGAMIFTKHETQLRLVSSKIYKTTGSVGLVYAIGTGLA